MSSNCVTVQEVSPGIVCAKNQEMEVWFTTLGAAILKILVKDKNGNTTDVALGYESIEDYARYQGYLGAIVGRFANRIRKGQFKLNGKAYQIEPNNGPNANHGGPETLSFKHFNWMPSSDGVIFYVASPDGDGGFPGALMLMVNYILEGNTLRIKTVAAADEDTVCNFTSHLYLNLSGEPKSIKDHTLKLKSLRTGKVDGDGLTTGDFFRSVGTVFDFTEEKVIGPVLEDQDPQILTAKGLDHSFLLENEEEQAVLYCPETGIECAVTTTLPVFQIYSANYVGGEPGKYGKVLEKQSGICFEAQYLPDEINLNPLQAQTILRKGESWNEEVKFQFRIR